MTQRPGAFSLLRTKVARRLLAALLLAGILPLLAALGLAFALLEFSMGVGLNQTVKEALGDDVPLYGALFEAKKAEYRATTRALALVVPGDGTLQDALRSHPELGSLSRERAAVTTAPEAPPSDEQDDAPPARGEVLEQATRAVPGRAFEVTAPLPGRKELLLRAVFHLPPRLDAGLDRSRNLAESYGAITRARGAITRGLLLTFSVVVAGVLLGAAALALIIARSITRKVAILSEAARQAATGDLSVRVSEHWYDELGELARAFNRMLGEIAEGRDRIVYLEKISGWQEVARRLAHEIKNPLTPMVLAVQELAEKAPAQPESYARLARTAREIVEEEASTLRTLVQEFSDFARLPDVHADRTELNAFVRDWAEGAKDVVVVADLSLDLPAASTTVGLDRLLFRRVLTNLVHNAVEAQGIPMRGAVQPGPPHAVRPRVAVRVAVVDGAAVLSVDDAGPGVAPQERLRIFEPYITTKQHGTGLGLAIVKKIVLQHGGQITVTQAALGGASFQLRLPLLR